MKYWRTKQQMRGQMLVELLVAIAIMAVGGSAVVLLVLNAFRSVQVGEEQSQAAAFGTEGAEIARSISKRAWGLLKAGVYGSDDASGYWEFSGSADVLGDFTRTIIVEDVERDGLGDIVSLGGTRDVQIKKIISTVSWATRPTITRTFSFVTYLTNWDSANFFHDTVADFTPGTRSQTNIFNVDDGEVGLQTGLGAAGWACLVFKAVFNTPSQVQNGLGVYVVGDVGYLTTENSPTGHEFWVLDITDRENPVYLGSTELGGGGQAVFVQGSYAYVASDSNTAEFQVVDITTPTAPAVVATLNLSATTDATRLFVSGTYAFVAQGTAIRTINISAPTSPALLGAYTAADVVRDLVLDGNYLLVASANNSGEFFILDVTTPAAPSLASTLDLPSNSDATRVRYYLTTAFVVSDNNPGGSEFYTINTTNKSAPALLGSVDLGSSSIAAQVNALAIDSSNSLAFVGLQRNEQELQVVEWTTVSAPTVAQVLNVTGAPPKDLFYDGTHLYAANSADNAEFNIFEPLMTPSWSCPERIGTLDLGVNANAVRVYGATAYVVTNQNTGAPEFDIINVSDPENPTITGTLEIGNNTNDVVVSGSYAYVGTSSSSGEVRVIDISTPTAPVQIASLNLSGSNAALSLAVSGSTLFVGRTGSSGGPSANSFVSVNITVPTAPSVIGQASIGGDINSIVMMGSFAVCATAHDSREIAIVNVTTPASPSLYGSFNTPNNSDGNDVWVNGSTGYLVTASSPSGGEMYIVDLTNPAAPAQTGIKNLGNSSSSAIAISDTEAVAFTSLNLLNQEIKLWDITVPSSPVFLALIGELGGFVNDMDFETDYLFIAANATATGQFIIYRKIQGSGGGGGGGGFSLSGTFDSPEFDAGGVSNWNTVEWTEDTLSCAGSDLSIQFKSSTTLVGLATELWQGPDGKDADETDFYTDPLGTEIHTDHNGDRYAQYRISLSSDGTCTPYLYDILITYTPL